MINTFSTLFFYKKNVFGLCDIFYLIFVLASIFVSCKIVASQILLSLCNQNAVSMRSFIFIANICFAFVPHISFYGCCKWSAEAWCPLLVLMCRSLSVSCYIQIFGLFFFSHICDLWVLWARASTTAVFTANCWKAIWSGKRYMQRLPGDDRQQKIIQFKSHFLA